MKKNVEEIVKEVVNDPYIPHLVGEKNKWWIDLNQIIPVTDLKIELTNMIGIKFTDEQLGTIIRYYPSI